jgi:type I restriction enzyme M protein
LHDQKKLLRSLMQKRPQRYHKLQQTMIVCLQLYTPQPASKKNDEKKKEKKAATPEDVVCDLLPVSIVIDEYFAEKRDVIAAAEELLAQNEGQLAELVEGQAENYLDEDNFPDSKMTDANVKKRIKALDRKIDADEIAVLQKYLDLKGDISLNKKLIKERKYDLLTALVVKYADLSEEEIKRLVIEKKWFASLALRLDGEMQRISQQLTSKVSALAERYAQTLSEIDADISDLEAKVAAYLKQMGY